MNPDFGFLYSVIFRSWPVGLRLGNARRLKFHFKLHGNGFGGWIVDFASSRGQSIDALAMRQL